MNDPYNRHVGNDLADQRLSFRPTLSSVLGNDVLQQLGPIRLSRTQARDKEVMFLTPVLLQDSDYLAPYLPTKVSYALGDRLNRLAPPAIEQPNAGGLIIQIPPDNPEEDLSRVLHLQVLGTDDELVGHLNHFLLATRSTPMKLPLLE